MASLACEDHTRYVCDHCGTSYTAEEYDDRATICECNHLIVPQRDDEPLPCGATSFPKAPPVDQPPAPPLDQPPTQATAGRKAAVPAHVARLPTPSRQCVARQPEPREEPEAVAPDAAPGAPAAPASSREASPDVRVVRKRPAGFVGLRLSMASSRSSLPAAKRRRLRESDALPAAPLKASEPSPPVLRKNSLLAQYLGMKKRAQKEFMEGLSATQTLNLALQLSAREAQTV